MTTSWDDGHPLDWRIAELLAKHGLPGTFYIPRVSQRPTMPEADVRRLSADFEVGGHTLDHLALTTLNPTAARQQVGGCKAWVEDVIGQGCTAFCPPLGKFDGPHLRMIEEAEFRSVRTVELLSLDLPRRADGLVILPTAVQAHPHRRMAYVKNAVKRRSVENLMRAVTLGGVGWVALLEKLLAHALSRGGVVHLWGHSWEIEATGQWGRLDEALGILAQHVPSSSRVSNAELGSVASF